MFPLTFASESVAAFLYVSLVVRNCLAATFLENTGKESTYKILTLPISNQKLPFPFASLCFSSLKFPSDVFHCFLFRCCFCRRFSCCSRLLGSHVSGKHRQREHT
uniref:Secreted protein n=1 Tax=Caenorhabditis tropicalis TaxID=1561998 RepID=A0A1I7UXF4_9PELO